MTEPNVGPVEPPSPSWIQQQPFQNEPLDQQQGSYPPPAPRLDPAADVVWTSQYGVAPPVVRRAETASPWIALVCGLLSWVLVGAFFAGLYRAPLGLFSPIPAIIFGILGVRHACQGRTSHHWIAIVGFVLAAIASVPLFFGLLLNILLTIATR